MTTDPSIPNTYRLSPLSDPSCYISLRTNDSNAFLTSNLFLALVLYSQPLTPDPAIDFKICTVDSDTDIYPAQNSCLDQWGNNLRQATLQTAEAVTGQAWNRTWSDNDSDGGPGGWTLRSEFAGPARRLTVDTDGLTVIMEEGDDVGAANALWAFDDASDAGSTATESATASTTGADRTDDASTNEDMAADGLSSGAIAGIVVGVLAFVLVVVSVLYMWWRRRRRQRSARGVQSDKVDGTIGRQELTSDEKGGTSKLERSPAELQEVRRVELEGNTPNEKKKPVYELPT